MTPEKWQRSSKIRETVSSIGHHETALERSHRLSHDRTAKTSLRPQKGLSWVRSRTPAVVRVFQKRVLNPDNKESFFWQEILLHVKWLDIRQFEYRGCQSITNGNDPAPLELPPFEEEYEDIPEDQPRDLDELMVVASFGPNGELGSQLKSVVEI
ncbi:hypothetical protein AVEN_21157-1 [Araneus ventricosus]|uniref:Uncharacterized protein n=1 Tax=Araneus ventricosus TaxID=182803 RepID=A0A4Y2P0L1_ARAVE|nr:hypothetical protein AVEN_21157-1 [Araneus ventricosus]